MSDYPSVFYPTCVEGKVWADTLRFESLDGSEIFLSAKDLPLGGWTYNEKEGCFYLNDFKPFEYQGKAWGLTHQQKQSRRGWLKMSPDCNHWWYFIRPQQREAGGGWIPGSEWGKYLRWGKWRWDVAGTNGQHWIGPGTYYINFSAHWD